MSCSGCKERREKIAQSAKEIHNAVRRLMAEKKARKDKQSQRPTLL